MARPPSACDGNQRSAGFALIIVLWTLVLIGFITAQLVTGGRTELRIASNLVANAVANAAAEGAVFQSIFDLLGAAGDDRTRLDDNMEREIRIGECRIAVLVQDEAARINPNLASPALLEALLRMTGSDPGIARQLAAGIGEWVGAPGAARNEKELFAEYRAAGLSYAPPGEPFETLEELQRVRGMTPAVYAAIRPHLSLFAPAEPRIDRADPVVASALRALGQNATGSLAETRQSDLRTLRIAVSVEGPSGARSSRTAIARLSRGSASYKILSWNPE